MLKGKTADGFVTLHEGKDFYADLTTRISSDLIQVRDSGEMEDFTRSLGSDRNRRHSQEKVDMPLALDISGEDGLFQQRFGEDMGLLKKAAFLQFLEVFMHELYSHRALTDR